MKWAAHIFSPESRLLILFSVMNLPPSDRTAQTKLFFQNAVDIFLECCFIAFILFIHSVFNSCRNHIQRSSCVNSIITQTGQMQTYFIDSDFGFFFHFCSPYLGCGGDGGGNRTEAEPTDHHMRMVGGPPLFFNALIISPFICLTPDLQWLYFFNELQYLFDPSLF